MKNRVFRYLTVILLGLNGCHEEAAQPPLAPDEQALVDAYVRITVLQALHDRSPDSTATALAHLATEIDSTALRRTMDRLSQDPMRWELVYDAIATKLEELESTPALWWSFVRGDTLRPVPPDSTPAAAPVRVPIESERAPDH